MPVGTSIGDHVWVWYTEHSIPTRNSGTVHRFKGDYVIVRLDPPHKVESGNLVCVPWSQIHHREDI